MQPRSATVPGYLPMLAGNEAAGIRQGPIEVLVTPDVDAALALNRHAQRTAVRQARLVLDSKRQAHRRLLCGRSSDAVRHRTGPFDDSVGTYVDRRYRVSPVWQSFKPHRLLAFCRFGAAGIPAAHPNPCAKARRAERGLFIERSRVRLGGVMTAPFPQALWRPRCRPAGGAAVRLSF